MAQISDVVGAQWRLPLLFLISGIGTHFALSSKNWKQYLKERLIRLLIPLIAGILIVVPPQIYLERLSQGVNYNSYFDFYPHFFKGIYPTGNFSWHHLWFLPYLFLMSVVALPLFLQVRKQNCRLIKFLKKLLNISPVFLFIPVLLLIPAVHLLYFRFPFTHALIDDWFTITFNTIVFITGFTLVSLGDVFWKSVKQLRKYALTVGVISFTIFLDLWANNIHGVVYSVSKAVNIWSWILTILGFAAKYLNKERSTLKYRNNFQDMCAVNPVF